MDEVKRRQSKRLFLTGLLAILLLVLPTHLVSARSTDGLLARIEKKYRSIKTLTADFTQVSKGLSASDGASGGVVYFKRPGRIRWSYKGDITDEIIGDRKVLWFYQPDLNQAFKSRGARPGIATDFLSGMVNIRKYFSVEAAPRKAGLISIRLKPREYQPGVKSLVLEVDGKTLLVRGFTLVDHYGNTTRVSFTRIRVNPPVKDGVFRFTPPPGTVIIEK